MTDQQSIADSPLYGILLEYKIDCATTRRPIANFVTAQIVFPFVYHALVTRTVQSWLRVRIYQ